MSVRSRSSSSGVSSKPQSSLGIRKSAVSEDKLDKLLHVLNRSTLTIDHARDVRETLKSADKKWTINFLKAKGLHLLSVQLVNFHTNPTVLTDGPNIIYELLLAVKSAMNCKLGLDIVIRDPDLVSSLALNIDCHNVVVCTQTLELLAVLMVSGEGGSKAVLDALDFLKLIKRERVRFQSLVDALAAFSQANGDVLEQSTGVDSMIAFKRDIMFFLNTVVNSSVELEDRLEIRADLIYAGILPTIEKLKVLCFDELVKDVPEQHSPETMKRIEELHELESQLQVFETVLQRDVTECITELETTFDSSDSAPGVDLSDPEQIFQSLLASAVEQECFFPLLRVLQTLLMIPSYDVFGKKQWELVENTIKKIVIGTIFENDAEDTTTLLDSKHNLDWKQRVEELSQQVDMLAFRCQILEEEESVLKEELQELRVRESSLQYLRMGDVTRHTQDNERRVVCKTDLHQREIKAAESQSIAGIGTAAIHTEIMQRIKSGNIAQEDLKKFIDDLESQLQDVKGLQGLDEKVSLLSEKDLGLKLAVPFNGQKPIPQAPPLPLDLELKFTTTYAEYLKHQCVFGLECAPPLPSALLGNDFYDSSDNALPSKVAHGRKKTIIEPNVPMRSLFWTKIPENRLHGTIWEELSDDNVELNVAKLESLFCKSLISSVNDADDTKDISAEKREKSRDISLLDTKVQQNVGIALAKLRMPSHEICRAIIQMDSSRLDLDKLVTLRALVPNKDDISVLNEYDGDVEKLGKVEKFFLHINDIPRYVPRLDCFIFMHKFQLLVSEMYQQFDIVGRALDQLESSTYFRRVLEVVLALGNYLNGSSPRGGLYGFKLDGLLKLSAVKSVDNKSNLMHFLVKQCKAIDENMLGVVEELSVADEASRISLEVCKMEINSLRSNLKTVEETIEAQRLDPAPDENDKLVEVLSPFKLEAKVEIEKLDDEFKNINQRFYKTVLTFGGDDDQNSCTSFFSLIKDFIHGFAKAHRDIEKRRVMKIKMEKKRIAEEKAKKARREKKIGVSDAETLIDDVFFALKGKKADEILDSLKCTSSHHHPGPRRGPKNSKRRIGTRPKRRVGAAEEFNADDDDDLAAMMLKLGVRESKPPVSKLSIETKLNDSVEDSSGSDGNISTRNYTQKNDRNQVSSNRASLASPEGKRLANRPLPLEKQLRSPSGRIGGLHMSPNRNTGRKTPIKKDTTTEDDELLSFLNRKKAGNK